MRRNLASPDRTTPPLHLDKIKVAVDFDDTVDLLDYALTTYPFYSKRLAYAHPVCFEQTIQHALQSLATSVSV